MSLAVLLASFSLPTSSSKSKFFPDVEKMDSVVRVEGADCLETFLSEHLKVSGRVCSPERGFQPPFEGWLQLGQYRFLFGILLQERIRTKKTEQKVELKRISTNLLSLNCLKIVVMNSGFQLFSPSLWST